MTASQAKEKAYKIYFQKRVFLLLFFGFSSGLPYLLVSATLKLWLREMDIEISTIGIFAIVMTPYTFKFVWAPLMDQISLPFLSKRLGHRRSWILFAQFLLLAAVFLIGFFANQNLLLVTGVVAFLAAFCAATQDISIDAYRVEILKREEFAAGAGMYAGGFRIAMLVASAGVLYIAEFSTWFVAYSLMAGLFLVGVLTTLFADEPEFSKKREFIKITGLPFNVQVSEIFHKAILEPFKDFMQHKGWVLILLFIIFYKLGDNMVLNLANPFYVDMKFTKEEIANITKIFGLIATLTGLALGGILMKKYGLNAALWVGGILQLLSNAVFAVQAHIGHDVAMLAVTVGSENIATGIGTTAFMALLASLCNIKFSATQYALFSSLFNLAGSWFSAPAGFIQEEVGWVSYFLIMTAATVPGLILLFFIKHSTYLKKDVLA